MPTLNYVVSAGAIIGAETSSAPALELTLQKQMKLLQSCADQGTKVPRAEVQPENKKNRRKGKGNKGKCLGALGEAAEIRTSAEA